MLEIRYAPCRILDAACQVMDTMPSSSSIRLVPMMLVVACATIPIAVRRFQILFDKLFWKFGHVQCQLFAYLKKDGT